MSLAIVLYTAEGPRGVRTGYARETVEFLRRNVVWPEPVWWHIADDRSSADHLKAIHEAAKTVEDADAGHTVGHWSTSHAATQGYGGNVNAARAAIAEQGGVEFLLCVEDDWRLVRPLDLDPMVAMLRDSEMQDVGMVRLSYIAYTAQLYGLYRYAAHHQWLELRRDSPEGFIFSGNPRLEHWDFQKDFRWAEGRKELPPHAKGYPGEYELDAAWRLKLREKGERTEVVFPVDFIPSSAQGRSYFQHFGTERSFAL